jgi:hypothetical protein
MPRWKLVSNWPKADYRTVKAQLTVKSAKQPFLKRVARQCLEFDIVLDANQS